jgi:hypothetical protein
MQEKQPSKWEEQIWAVTISNQMIAAMLDEFIKSQGLDGGVKVDLVTQITVSPDDGNITFYFTHTKPLGRILEFVRPVDRPKPRRIPVRAVKEAKNETETE